MEYRKRLTDLDVHHNQVVSIFGLEQLPVLDRLNLSMFKIGLDNGQY